MKKFIVKKAYQILVIILLLQIFKTPASANGGCVPVYGGGVQCPRPGQVLVEKKVQSPSTGIYVDNLGPSDPKYRPQQLITFQIIVQNSGEQTLNSINVKDTLPQYVDFMSGPGNYDSKSKTVSWTVSNLMGGSSEVFYLKGRIVHPTLLPDLNIICPTQANPQPVNMVDAEVIGQKDHDESRFCIQKEIIVPVVPKAGPEHWLLTLAGFSILFPTGLILRKKVTF